MFRPSQSSADLHGVVRKPLDGEALMLQAASSVKTPPVKLSRTAAKIVVETCAAAMIAEYHFKRQTVGDKLNLPLV